MVIQRPAVAGLFIGLVLLVISSSAGFAGEPATTFNFKQSLDEAIDQASINEGIRLDPQVAVDIKSDAGLFVFNFCSAESINDSRSQCRTGLGDPDSLAELVGQYLSDTLSTSKQIETVASRLARRAGSEIEKTGWPALRNKSTGFLRIPASLLGATISLQTAGGLRRLRGNGSVIVLNSGSQNLIAVDGGGSSSIVRVEIVPGVEAIWTDKGPESIGRIDVAPASYCSRAYVGPITQPLYAFNWGRASFAESDEERAMHMAKVAKQPALDIHVVDETGKCNQACELGLGIAFAQAIAVWRSGCERCGREMLSSIRVGTNVWVDRRAYERLLAFDPGRDASEMLDLLSPVKSDVVLPAAPSLSVPAMSVASFEQVVPDSDIGRKLCGLDSELQWVLGAKSLLCNDASTISGEKLHPILIVRPQPTDCGKEAIACGMPGGLVQVSTSSYSFNVDTPAGPVLLGASRKQLNVSAVILHEVGHWFGVPHPEQVDVAANDVMTGVFDNERTCVSAASLTMLNNALDNRWEFRARSPQGLLPPRDVP